ncbi:two-component sensor histidine kinase [Agrobacterium vitis]|nr:two-component sensor histidine kinase [Agrobacterium vitis]MBE1436505.1 two-component sensor histidine kinase [Agrobacterium vitis]
MRRFSWIEPEEIDAVSRDFFIHALIDMGACYLLYNDAGRCICITGLPAVWQIKPEERPTDLSIFGEDIANRLLHLRLELEQAGDHAAIEIDLAEKGIYEFRCRKVSIPGHGLHFIMAIADKTEERRRERALRILLMEVSHRSKNLLAVVQGIASQTARFSGSLESFLQKFRGRLYALSKAQDIVTDSEWRGVGFMDLLAAQLELCNPGKAAQIEMTGANIMLSPNAAMHIGLALHELIVNSVNYGGGLGGPGSIRVSCHLQRIGDHSFICIGWHEDLPPLSVATDSQLKARFGSTVLEKVVPVSVNGTAVYAIDSQGISYDLRFPADVNE